MGNQILCRTCCSSTEEQKNEFKYNDNRFQISKFNEETSNEIIGSSKKKYATDSNNYEITTDYQISLLIKLQNKIKYFLKKCKNCNTSIKKIDNFHGEYSYFGNTFRYLKNGFGIQTWKEGAKYVGLWEKNIAQGLGIYFHDDNNFYKGEFIEDKANGYGIFKDSNGLIYEGDWKNDFQNGIGTEKWSDSAEYDGEYFNGKKHGIGN